MLSLGLTFKSGVFVDCTWVKQRMDAGVYWLNLYTMLSRATALENLLLFNPPKTREDNGSSSGRGSSRGRGDRRGRGRGAGAGRRTGAALAARTSAVELAARDQ